MSDFPQYRILENDKNAKKIIFRTRFWPSGQTMINRNKDEGTLYIFLNSRHRCMCVYIYT